LPARLWRVKEGAGEGVIYKNTPDFSGVFNLLFKNYSKAASAADKILNILTPVSGSTACAAGRPFLSITLVTFETSTSTDLRDFTE
jgi:hypothetical protein